MGLFDLGGLIKGRAFYAIALVGLLFWLVHITEPVPNFDEKTQTVIKSPTDFIVPVNISYFWAILGTALVIALFMSDVQAGRKITEREASKITQDEIKYKKDILHDPRFQGVVEIGNVRPRRNITRQGSEIYKWVVGVNVKQGDDQSYYQVELNPEGGVEAVMSRKWEFGLVDTCWKCGEHGDIKTMLPQEIHDLIRIRGAVTR